MLELDGRFKVLARVAEQRRAQLLEHELYRSLGTLPALRGFMEHHVFAVWDFMSLLTRLQLEVSGLTVPWTPSLRHSSEVRRFVNEIKLGEESDLIDGTVVSHFELYVQAMRGVGADVAPVLATVAALQVNPNAHVADLAAAAGAPPGAVRFLANTMRVAQQGRLAAVAASFAFGREELIPDMFRQLVERHVECELLDRYLQRHIEVDEGEHGPLAHRLLAALCETDDDWLVAQSTVAAAIEARYRLWTDALDHIRSTHR